MTTFDEAELNRFIVERVAVGVIAVNASMEILQFNKFMEMNTGISHANVIGKNLFECFPDVPRKWLEQKIRGVFIVKNFAFSSWKQRPYLFAFAHNRPVTGGVDQMQQDITFIPVKDANGDVRAVCLTIFDATDACLSQRAAEDASHKLQAALVEVEKLSTRDGLTGILNRRALDQRFAEELARSRRYKTPLAFMMFDLDHFKKVNDTFGHLGGDTVLQSVAKLVSGMIRDTDIFARYGGEELALLLPGIDASGAAALGERLRAAIVASPVPFNDLSIPVTVSIGVTEARTSTSDMKELMAEADSALYECKRSGRNRVMCFTPPPAP